MRYRSSGNFVANHAQHRLLVFQKYCTLSSHPSTGRKTLRLHALTWREKRKPTPTKGAIAQQRARLTWERYKQVAQVPTFDTVSPKYYQGRKELCPPHPPPGFSSPPEVAKAELRATPRPRLSGKQRCSVLRCYS